jgi:hypothetical protein
MKYDILKCVYFILVGVKVVEEYCWAITQVVGQSASQVPVCWIWGVSRTALYICMYIYVYIYISVCIYFTICMLNFDLRRI